MAEAARLEALAALEALRGESTGDGPVALEAGILRLERVVAMDASALARDAAHFLLACGPVGILPPTSTSRWSCA